MFRSPAFLALCLVSYCVGCSNDSATPIAKGPAESKPSERPSRAVIEVALPEPPANMKEEVAKARELWANGSPNFVRAINIVKSGFAMVEPAIGDQVPSWTKVTLNTSGAGMDAIRVDAGRDVVLLWAFAKPAGRNIIFNIADPRLPHLPGFADTMFKYNLKVPELDSPEHSVFIFQPFDGGERRPATEYIVWFVFEDDKPMELYFKLRSFERNLVPAKHFTKPQDAANLLGFELPFRFTADATLADHAQNTLELNGAQAALQYLDQEASDTSTGRDKLFYARLAHKYAVQLVEDEDDRQIANPYFLKSAALLRELLAENGQLEPQDVQLVPHAFYNEACAFALTGKQDDAMRSLKEAVECGFRDAAWIRGDDDLQSLHDLPAFKQLIEELETRR